MAKHFQNFCSWKLPLKSFEVKSAHFYWPLLFERVYFGMSSSNIDHCLIFVLTHNCFLFMLAWYYWCSKQSVLKGQVISKGFLMSLISSKKRTKKFDFTSMIPQVDLFSFVFWRKSKAQKTILKLSDLLRYYEFEYFYHWIITFWTLRDSRGPISHWLRKIY